MMIPKTVIRKIEPDVADTIIDTRQPRGLFYVRLGGIYLGIDNSTGDAWTEAFNCLRQCRRWLSNPNIHYEGA